jgi:tripartite-type tricarboxylate transporter receptor subunit TctC
VTALCLGVLGIGALAPEVAATSAAAAAEPYANAQVRLVVGVAVGGSYDISGRLVARYLARHIPGNPTIVPQNMPGASSLVAANWLYNVAPQDGTVIGVLVPTTVIFGQLFSDPNARFDIARFNWIGNPINAPTTLAVWYKAPAQSWVDAKTKVTIIGAPAPNGPDAMLVNLANSVLGTKFKIVTGYEGGDAITLGMEKGEIDGKGSQSWAGWKATRPDWVRDHKLTPLFQVARHSDPELQKVPLLADIAEGAENRAIVNLYTDVNAIGRVLAMGPDVPREKVAIIRHAFDETMKDPDFIADADKLRLELGPMSGEEIQGIVRRVVSLDPSVVGKLKDVVSKSQ